MQFFQYHDAKTGEFVSKTYADTHPDMTVKVECHPNLGMATTEALIAELAARVSLASIAGEAWPNYSTVKGS